MIAGHRFLGAFTVGEGVVAGDGREPDADVAFQARAGQWHAYLREDRALLAVHADFLARAGDPPLSYGGDRAQGLAAQLRAARYPVTADWKALKKLLANDAGKAVEAVAKAEPGFVARWGIGPIRVGIFDEDAGEDGGDDDEEVGANAHGCWATTTGEDGWAVYAVFEGDDVVVVRVRLSSRPEDALP